MKIKCPTCPHTVRAGDAATALAYLAATHACENNVDPDNDPRRPR